MLFHVSLVVGALVFLPLVGSSSSIIRPLKFKVFSEASSKNDPGFLSTDDEREFYVASYGENTSSWSVIPRGGSVVSPSSLCTVFVIKLRNLIKSALEICELHAPWLTKPFQSTVKIMENILGLRLCPYEEEELKVQRKKKGKQKKLKKTKKENLSKYSSGKFEEEEEVRPQSKGSEEKSKSKNDASTKWNYKDLKSSNPNHRIQRELKQFITSPPPNLSVKVGKNIRVWIVTMRGANNTIYEGETYRLKITFPDRYPIVPPSAYFLKPTPRHEHVYTNGDICLSLLGKDWRPTMTAQSIAVSILSILSSAKKKSLPMDNSRVAGQKPGMSQENWVYHDDNC
jgi:ubiquitin-conjugating enzyme E2 W